MILGMSLAAFTRLHVIISLAGILSGFVVMAGFFAGKRMRATTAIFLVTTALTSLTGFLFPFHEVTPAIILGVLSLIVLTVAIAARARGWAATFAITSITALYFNVFVLVVQSFRNIPALHALAPQEKEPPFAIAQLVVLVLFGVLGFVATGRFKRASALPLAAR